jgi:hypothetical protein
METLCDIYRWKIIKIKIMYFYHMLYNVKIYKTICQKCHMFVKYLFDTMFPYKKYK